MIKPLTPAQEQKINTMGSEEIKEFLHNVSVENGEFRRDIYSPDVLIPIPQTPEVEHLTRIFSVNGKKYSVDGESEAELVSKELEVHRALLGGTEVPEATTVVARDEHGRFTSVLADTQEEDEGLRAAREADWRQKLMTGQCDAITYIRETKVLDSYLKEFGLDRQAVAEQRETSAWRQSSADFLKRHPEWKGGENLKVIQDIIVNADWKGTESRDEMLEQAYAYMLENDLEVENPAVSDRQAIAQSWNLEDIRAAAKRLIGQPSASENYTNWRDNR